MDPRLAAAACRLGPVRRLVAVTGGKGGIGKTLVSATVALALARQGRRCGLLDLDFTGPGAHLALGAADGFPREDFGILPVDAHGVEFMSITCFSGATAAPLRGAEVASVLLELLAITRWGELDVLVIDMPPGLGDAALETARLLPRAEYLVVATASRLVLETVRRTLELLRRMDLAVLGLVENAAPPGAAAPPVAGPPTRAVADLALAWQLPVLGRLPLDPAVEERLGQPEALLATAFGRAVAVMVAGAPF